MVVDKDVGSTDLPGLHPESGGQGWGASLLECVAIIEVGGHQDGCATGCAIHPFKGVKTVNILSVKDPLKRSQYYSLY